MAIYVTEDKKYLFTDFHHIIADGNSYDIIFEDINKAYMGEKLEKESYTGFDAALDEEQQMKEGKYKKAEKYYDSIFEGIETESLPMPDLNGKAPEKVIWRRPGSERRGHSFLLREAGCYPEYFIYRSVRHPYGKILQCRG